MKKYPLIGKGLAVGIILLFVGTCITPTTAQKINETDTSSYDGKQFLELYENYGFGYRLYDPDSQYDPGPVLFKLDEPGTIYTLAYDNNTITGGCYDSYTYTWYVCDDSGNIWTIDIWSGDMTLIGGNSESLSALAIDPQTGTMYGAYEDWLYGIDKQTGNKLWEWSVAGPGMNDISGMAADGLGHLYIVDKFTNLYRLVLLC